MRYAFFDLDGTLLPWDTQLLFADFVLRRQPWRRVLLLPVLLVLPLKAVGLVSSRFVKRVFLGFLAGMSGAEVLALAEEFAGHVVDRWIWPEMREAIEARRREGCILVLNTASPSFYAEPIARRLDFSHCLSTDVEIPERMPWIPVFPGANNKREAKIVAMRERGPLSPDTVLPIPGSWTYTDSSADLPLLTCAEHGVLVDPRPALAAMAQERGWTILRPSPEVSRVRRILAAVAMCFGCWGF